MERYKKEFKEGFNIKEMLDGYLETALWAETDDDGEPLDDNFTLNDISPEARKKSIKDCKTFVKMARNLIDGFRPSLIGHDFWLTRNGHGAGFWDGDYEEDIGAELTSISDKFNNVFIYAGDDGLIYID